MHITTNAKNLPAYRTYIKVEEATERFLKEAGYLKMTLPVLSPALVPESYLEVFRTEFKYFDRKEDLFLTPSPELFLKRLLARGIGSCYSLGKSFRNAEPSSDMHSFEFTMLEYYRMGATYLDIADELLLLLRALSRAANGTDAITFQTKKVSFTRWERLTVAEAFQRYAGIMPDDLLDKKALLKRAAEKGYAVEGFTYEDLFSQIYVQEIEAHLGTNGFPTLLYDYPREFAALAKLNPDGKTAQRFEFYIEGHELGDCYTELTDWKEQEERFGQEDERRRLSHKIPHPVDKGFIEALQYGLDDCAGIAIGFDRLAMILADVTSIHDLRLVDII